MPFQMSLALFLICVRCATSARLALREQTTVATEDFNTFLFENVFLLKLMFLCFLTIELVLGSVLLV